MPCRTTKQTIEALKAAGFEVLDVCDLATTADIPWWDPVDPDNWWRLQSECQGWSCCTRETHFVVCLVGWLGVPPALPSAVCRQVYRCRILEERLAATRRVPHASGSDVHAQQLTEHAALHAFCWGVAGAAAADFRTTKAGRMVTHALVKNLERFGVAPKGSLEVASMLERAADGLVAGGKQGIFTPLFFFLVRKPTHS